MSNDTSDRIVAGLGRLERAAAPVITVVNWLVALAGVGVLVALLIPFSKSAAEAEPPPMPANMVDVDWHDPGSSKFCLACHKRVSRAAGGIEVERGHSQNVPLREDQLAAVAAMGTIAGPDDTLICMSCHVLGEGGGQFMLADTLDGSALCQRCHPGHYAQGTPHDLRLSAPHETNRRGWTTSEAGPCSACHLAHSHAREIERSPLDPDGKCVTCHSEQGVAAGHARLTMDHPESHCSECHNPHDMTHGEFLSVPVDELCVRCHAGYDAGPQRGMHSLGHMDYPVPAALIADRAHTMGEPQELTCVICHDTHLATEPKLLHQPIEDNTLCLTCHREQLTEMGDGHLPRHGQAPPLNEEQQAAVATWGGQIGPEGQLLCVSCHQVHGGRVDTHLLAFWPKYGETCVACHPETAVVFGSEHDLRVKFPQVTNNQGMNPVDAGACSACHLAHQFPRERVAMPGDPDGVCSSCHRPGECGEALTASGASHPGTRCTDCHDPHDRHSGQFLNMPEPQLCTSCHAAQGDLRGGPHDLSTNPDEWPAAAREAGGLCLPCHVPHGGDRPDLFRAAAGEPVGNHDEICLVCHDRTAWGADSAIAALHPQKIDPDTPLGVNLALVPTDEAGNPRMGCRTCHEPHGPAEPPHLARIEPGEPTESLCLHCHEDKQLITLSAHAPQRLAAAGYDTDSCKPCHAMHAAPDATWGNVLSPRFLLQYCGEGTNVNATDCVPCLACHTAEGPAPTHVFEEHPEVLAMNVFEPDDAGYMPLFGPDGRIDPQGQVTCRTCHLSHGRLDLLERLAANEELSDAARHAMNAQVREFNAPNLCTTCHGEEARQLYLYFHNPEWRTTVPR